MLAFPMRPSPSRLSSQACANCFAVPPRPLSLSIEAVVRAGRRAQFARPLFSWSYKSSFPQTLRDQILTKHPGVSPPVAFVPRTQHSLCCAFSDNSCVVSNLPALGFSCRSFSRSSPLFSIACGLFCKIPGGWGTRALHAASASPHLPQRNVDAGRTSNYHYCKFQVPGSWMKLPN
jgi:hypothetical protein